MDYKVVDFLDSKEVAVVSSSWLLGETKTAWPLKHCNMLKLLKEHKMPQRYSVLDIRIIKSASEYQHWRFKFRNRISRKSETLGKACRV